MVDPVSQTVLLCEDRAHEGLVRAYMRRCGLRTDPRHLIPKVASKMQQGGNAGWVLAQFPRELQACRRRRARTRLIAVIDADHFEVEQRRRELLSQAESAAGQLLGVDEPVAVLIPKRNVETWLCCLLGTQVNERDDYKSRENPRRDVFRLAADSLFAWSRLNANVPEICVPSLVRGLPDWRKIG